MTNEEHKSHRDPLRSEPKAAHPKPSKNLDTTLLYSNIDLLNAPLSDLSTIMLGTMQTIHPPLGNLDTATVGRARELNDTIAHLRREVEDKAMELKHAETGAAEKIAAIAKLEASIAQLTEKERLSFLLARVNEDAQALLLSSERFRKPFLDLSECHAFVMSVDIRRSTELMLKARSPEQFAHFITTLCKDLEEIVKAHFGVFDKFTGDGILAFFPDFFSGEDAAYQVIAAADDCHRLFRERYREFRSSFTAVLTDVGLGIGIDYGPAHLVQMAGGLTVVGAPVVYACRMAGAPPGTTLLNQPGYEKVSERFSGHCFFNETELDIKNEGTTLAYEVRLNRKEYQPKLPSWLKSAGAGEMVMGHK
jgi:class 3 adenylate cyclase